MIFKNYCQLGEANVVYDGETHKTIIGICDLSDGMAMWRCKYCSIFKYKCKYLNIHKINDNDFVANCESIEALADSVDIEIERLGDIHATLIEALKMNIEKSGE